MNVKHKPDIEVTPRDNGRVNIVSHAMRCDYWVPPSRVDDEVASIIREYNDLIEAGVLTTPEE